MFKKRFLLAVTLVLILTGCVPTNSVNPLYTEKDLIFDPALLGSWVNTDGKGFYKFEKAGEKDYELTMSDDKGSFESKYEARLLRLKDMVFLDLYLKSVRDKGERVGEEGMGVSFVHTFFQVRIEGDTLRYRFLDDEWVESLAKEAKLKVSHRLPGKEGTILLTASTKDLQKFVLKYARDEEAFPIKDDYQLRRETPLDVGKAHLKQGRNDEGITALRQALEGAPNNSEAYASLGDAYSKKGSFREALDAWKRASELEPENGDYRTQVGNAFFRLGDYSQARSEWDRALEMKYYSDYIPEAKYKIALSYFLEGQRSQALEQFEKYFAGRIGSDAEAVVWYSLALREAGRNDEAGALFIPEDWSIALVKYSQRKLTDAQLFAEASDEDERCQAFFHVGYRYFESGRREVAREFFLKALETKGFTAYEYEAAHALLKRLEAE